MTMTTCHMNAVFMADLRFARLRCAFNAATYNIVYLCVSNKHHVVILIIISKTQLFARNVYFVSRDLCADTARPTRFWPAVSNYCSADQTNAVAPPAEFETIVCHARAAVASAALKSNYFAKWNARKSRVWRLRRRQVGGGGGEGPSCGLLKIGLCGADEEPRVRRTRTAGRI